MTLRRRDLIAALALLAWRPAHARAQTGASLVAAMRAGGVVVFLRHAATVASQIDTGRLGDRGGQRNLSPAGIRQARELGAAFRALRIPIAEVLASPVFRARDTAELAFGAAAVRVTTDLVADEYAGGQVRQMVEATRRLLSTPPPARRTRLLVGHRTPLELATGRRFPDSILPEGALAVFEPRGGEARLLGTLTADGLAAQARLASRLQTPAPREAM